MKRVALGLVLGVLGLIAGVSVFGWASPREHSEVIESEFDAPLGEVFATVTTPATYPDWRSGVSVEELSTDPLRFAETSNGDRLTFVVTEQTATRWVTRIDDPSLPFGGTWTHEFSRTPDGRTRLRSTEDGFVDNVFVRGMARLLMDPRANLESFHADLSRRFSD